MKRPLEVENILRRLNLTTALEVLGETIARAERESWSYADFLEALLSAELEARDGRRVQRHHKESRLPDGKTLATMNQAKLPLKVRRMLDGLCRGDFLSSATNILVFGLPGRGKTHLCAAIGGELVRRGRRVYFTPTYQLVQRLLLAKRELELEPTIRKLDRFDLVILDDLGYIQQDRDEMEVLFTFLAARYERRSVMITSNLVFSQWDRIFKDPMTTSAAIDRLVHRSIIVELTGGSIRNEEAQEAQRRHETASEPEERNDAGATADSGDEAPRE